MAVIIDATRRMTDSPMRMSREVSVNETGRAKVKIKVVIAVTEWRKINVFKVPFYV